MDLPVTHPPFPGRISPISPAKDDVLVDAEGDYIMDSPERDHHGKQGVEAGQPPVGVLGALAAAGARPAPR